MKSNHKCDNCGNEIYVLPSIMERQKNCYCSRDCRMAHRAEMAWGADKLQYVKDNCNHMGADDMAKHFKCKVALLYKQLNKWRAAGHDIPKLYKKKLQTSFKPVVVDLRSVLPPKKQNDQNKRFIPVTGFCCKTWVLR